MPTLRAEVRDLHGRAPVLVLTAILSLALFGAAAIGLLVDPRELLGAARGEQSHSNIDTPFDCAIFAALGIAIVWLLPIVLLVQHVRSPARDRALAMAFRIGLALNIIGSAAGWMTVQPQPAQLTAIAQGTHPLRVGAHTVGASDGGRGMPLTNWSRTNGDLRIPHFIGLHALQLLPLLVLLIRAARRHQRDDATERGLLRLAGGACVVVFVVALRQAVAGHPLLSPF